MTRFVRTALALGVLVLVAASLSLWPAAGGSQGTSSYVDCSFSTADAVLRVRIHDEEGRVRRRRDRIQVLEPTGGTAPRYEAIDCGPTATIDNTDLIRMRIDSIGSTVGWLSLRRGPFAPGLTSETGVPEIEILTTASEEDQALGIEGTQRNDHFRAGRLDGAEWVNLNPNGESTGADGDLRLPSARRAVVGLLMGRGDDTVTVNGGPEFDGSLGNRFVALLLGEGADYYRGRQPHAFIFAGKGADTIVTGRRFDFVLDDRGHDSIHTRGGRDVVFAVRGKDRVWTGEGNDRVDTKDGRRDRVHCGPGSDSASLDAIDRALSCEREADSGGSPLLSRLHGPAGPVPATIALAEMLGAR